MRLSASKIAYYHAKHSLVQTPKGESKYVAFDSFRPSGQCVKSKTITKKLEFFGKYLLLTLGQMAYLRLKRDKCPYITIYLHRAVDIYEEHEIFKN